MGQGMAHLSLTHSVQGPAVPGAEQRCRSSRELCAHLGCSCWAEPGGLRRRGEGGKRATAEPLAPT